MRVSLVIGSLFRGQYLDRLLASLVGQEHQAFEVIVVEQRDPVAARALLDSYDLRRARVLESPRGLSRARNVGLASVSGDIVAFPDDDCWYEPTTIMTAVEAFVRQPHLGFLCGPVVTSSGPMLRFPEQAQSIHKGNVWRSAASAGMFVSARACRQIGPFDEGLGLGADTDAGSGEETDFVLRGLRAGIPAMFDPELRVFHPSPDEVESRMTPQVGYRYGFGMGTVLRRHGYGPPAVTMAMVRPAVGSVVAGISGNQELRRFRYAVLRGRLRGYLNG